MRATCDDGRLPATSGGQRAAAAREEGKAMAAMVKKLLDAPEPDFGDPVLMGYVVTLMEIFGLEPGLEYKSWHQTVIQ